MSAKKNENKKSNTRKPANAKEKGTVENKTTKESIGKDSTKEVKNNTSKKQETVKEVSKNGSPKGKSSKTNNKSSINTDKDISKSEKSISKENKSANLNEDKSTSSKVENKKQNLKNSESKKIDSKKSEAKKQESSKNESKNSKINETKKTETKEEQVVFKSNKKNNSKTVTSKDTTTKNSKSQDQKNSKNQESLSDNIKKDPKEISKYKDKTKESEKVNNINTPEFFEKRDNKRRKVVFILITVISILIILMIFSTIFAIVHTMKPTVAKGVSIKNIDISNLTYNEAQEKLEEAFGVSLSSNIELKKDDYSYIIKSSDISLSYNLNKALDEAYGVGRNSNIINSNYSLIKTALFKKNIEFNFEYSVDELNQVINEVSTSMPGLVKQYSYYIEGNELIVKPGADGVKVKVEELKNIIENNIQNRNPMEIIKDFKNQIIEIPCEEAKADSIDIEKIHSEIYSEPKDAYYVEATETTEFAIYADVAGVDFAISMDEAKAIISEEGKEEYIIPINRKEANVTINNLGIEAFPYLAGKCTTNYDASNLPRSENLRIATSKINGTVIMPGEQFSFNGVVGERTVEAGYKDAKIYADGKVVDGLAGGICQISSTLYNAVLDANLQVDERYNHSFVASYLPAGRDATVVYGVKDFKFTNNRKFPIKIEANASGGVVSFNIYGIKEEKEYKVNIIPEITDTTPYTTQTITDYKLATGKTIIDQAGAPGYKVTTYKEVSLNGVVLSKEVISNDTYKVMTRIVRVGPTPTVEQ